MRGFKTISAALSLACLSAPALAASSVTDSIDNPSEKWAGIEYWGVQVSQFSMVDQLLTFNITDDSKIDIFMAGPSKFTFTDVLLNGKSIASPFTVDWSRTLKATGYAAAGAVSLRFLADYSCADCWGDWFGGSVQVTKADLPKFPTDLPPEKTGAEPDLTPVPTPDSGSDASPVAGAVPEPSTWLMAIVGMGVVGLSMRRRRVRVVNFG